VGCRRPVGALREAIGVLAGGLGRVHGQRRDAAGHQVEPDHLGPAVIALAHPVQMPVDEAREHAAAVEVDHLRVLAGESSDATALVVGRDDHAVTDGDRLDDGVLGVERRDLAVVEDQVGGVGGRHLLVHRLRGRRDRRHGDHRN